MMATVSSFGKDVASVRTKRTTTRKVREISISTRIVMEPLTSKKRNAMRTLMSKVGKALRGMRIAKPLNRPIVYRCNVVRDAGATIVRVTKTTKVALISSRREGPLGAAACNIKRMVHSTVSGKYEHFLIKVNKDTAGSKKIKVLRTLNCNFLSGSKGRIPFNTGNLGILRRVASACILPRLGRYGFGVTYSMAGTLYKRRKYDTMFNPRGNTAPRVVYRVSR